VSKITIVLLIILAILIAAMIALYFIGQRLQKKQDESQAMIDQNKQTVTLLVIDKKKLTLKESGLPQQVIDSTPWYARRGKLPIVKAKVGPQIVNMVCDEGIFDTIPLKTQIKADVSGIYIVGARTMKGKRLVSTEPPKKKGWWGRTMDRLQEKAGAKSVK